jgi:hypothetical protein
LKKLDDLPTLSQLKELEDLRVQLSLPGAEPAVTDDRAAATDDRAAATDDEDTEAESEQRHQGGTAEDDPPPQVRGLVAGGAAPD